MAGATPLAPGALCAVSLRGDIGRRAKCLFVLDEGSYSVIAVSRAVADRPEHITPFNVRGNDGRLYQFAFLRVKTEHLLRRVPNAWGQYFVGLPCSDDCDDVVPALTQIAISLQDELIVIESEVEEIPHPPTCPLPVDAEPEPAIVFQEPPPPPSPSWPRDEEIIQSTVTAPRHRFFNLCNPTKQCSLCKHDFCYG